jgi:hypothetical protein
LVLEGSGGGVVVEEAKDDQLYAKNIKSKKNKTEQYN